MLKRRLKRFYRPNIIKISLAFICLGLTLKFFVPVFTRLSIVPCRIIEQSGSVFGLCPINPDPAVSQINSYYLGLRFLDFIYQVFYLLMLVLVIPYTLACSLFLLYYRYIKSIIRK